jgi:peptidoglycan/LPS O-acetylase OafA/YrhL
VRRILALDGLRGVLAFVVASEHTLLLWNNSQVLVNAGLVAVIVFFVMSGYVLTRAWDDRPIIFAARRLVRLWPVYATCIVLGYALRGQLPYWPDLTWLATDHIRQSGAVLAPAWSVCVEAWMIPLIPGLVWCVRGGLSRLAVGLGVWGLLWYIAPFPFTWGGWFILGAASASCEPRSIMLEHKIPQYLGTISFSLYMIHPLVIELIVACLGHSAALLGLPASIGAAALLYRYVEEPSIRWSRAIRSRRPARVATMPG